MKKYPVLAAILAITLVLSGCSAQYSNPTIPTLLDPVSGRPPVEAAYVDDIFKMDLYALSVVPYVEGVSSAVSGSVDEIYLYPGKMVEKGYIYKGLKPVYWCSHCETALAEAEIEYADDPCTSIYVKFNVTKDNGVFEKLGVPADKAYFIIWTTTTWTIPANVGICSPL